MKSRTITLILALFCAAVLSTCTIGIRAIADESNSAIKQDNGKSWHINGYPEDDRENAYLMIVGAYGPDGEGQIIYDPSGYVDSDECAACLQLQLQWAYKAMEKWLKAAREVTHDEAGIGVVLSVCHYSEDWVALYVYTKDGRYDNYETYQAIWEKYHEKTQ